MAVKERNQQLRVVAEILLVHLPEVIATDQKLAHDLLAVAGLALQTIYDDAEKSAKTWDGRAYHSRAAELRDEWDWAKAAANYAIGLATRDDPLTTINLSKLKILIRPAIERPAHRQIQDPRRFQGAAQALRIKLENQRPVLRG